MPSESTTFSIAIDGTGRTFPCAPGDTVLRAALRAGIGLPYECNAGACGSCKVDLVDGALDDLFPQAQGIRERDRARGKWLACQSTPQGDCTIRSRLLDECVPAHRPLRQQATLAHWRDITHDIREFSFRVAGPSRFLAGQYALLQLPGIATPRAYSMSNVSNDEGVWQFMVRRTESGLVSNALFGLGTGAQVEIDGPYGLAYLRHEAPRDIVCIAGGSGLAPMVSILDAAAGHEQARHRGAWLFYGGRGPRDVPAIDHLTGDRHPGRNLAWHPVVSVPALAEGAGWQGEVGFVHEQLPRRLPRPLSDYEYYLAGPPPMIEATVRLLVTDHRVPQSQLHFDRFF